MFGDKWEPAAATIVAKNFKNGSVESGAVYTYVADIQPDSGAPPFRTELHEPHLMSLFRSPSEGSTVRALADVKHAKAKFDTDDPSLSGKTLFKAEKDRYNSAKASAPGTAARPGPIDGEDPRLQIIRMNIKLATRDGNTAEVDRLTEAMRKIEAGELPMPGSTPAKPDPIEQLQKLAALHASGVLTDEEFAAQKAKVLAS